MNARVATLIEMSVFLDHVQREGTRIGWRLKSAGLDDAFHAVTKYADEARKMLDAFEAELERGTSPTEKVT